jgi:ribosomal protein S12 methylthiotransferase
MQPQPTAANENMRTKKLNKDCVKVITLGCSKNMVDSEVLMHQLKANAFEVYGDRDLSGELIDGDVDAEEQPNVIVVNTCGFIDRAKEESINTILAYAKEKEEGKIDKLYVTGCLSQRYKDNLEAEIPEVDAFFGTLELPALLERMGADYKHDLIGERILLTPPHYAYLKISEGCNRTCSFCAIPLMRGGHVSKTIEDLVTEAKKLAANGVKELMLIAQELTYYGLDIYKRRALPELLAALNAVEGIEWIRLHYAYPSKFPREIFDAIRDLPKVCKYLDMPLQHISDRLLTDMRRQITKAETKELIEAARAAVPGIAIRTTFLVGYPNETKEDFQELVDFVKEMQFERVGVFQYSHEENTRAHDLEDNVTAKTKQNRANKLMAVQQEISYQRNQEKVGKVFKVLFDRKEGGYFIGRTEFDSPEVDNEVLVSAEQYVRLGDFANVQITEATDYDLYGKLV